MNVIHKRIPLVYEVVQYDQVVQTTDGPVLAREGDVIVTGVLGERWPVPSRRFAQAYEVSSDLRTCFAKARLAVAHRMDAPLTVTTPCGPLLQGQAGDFRLTYSQGDQAVVAARVFKLAYDVL